MKQNSYYQQCIDEMFGLQRFGIKLGLETIGGVLSQLGDPQKRFKSIHVAGTNGKGSVASTLAFILHLAGYRVGLYTSPHLVRFNERFCIDNRPVSDEEVTAAYETLKQASVQDRGLTFFEYATAMAFHLFAERSVDWAVIETGMGGRLDATNLIDPELSVITNISLEHREYLGDSEEAIAGEKGGIIKPGKPVVTGVYQEGVISVIEKIAEERSAPLFRLHADFRTEPDADGGFTYFGVDHEWPGMKTGMSGAFQVDNAALVLAGCEMLIRSGIDITPENAGKGLKKNRWPGRLEVVGTEPLVILDGAHNLVAARQLGEYLKTEMAGRKIRMIVGILDDKPYAEMLGDLLPVCHEAVITQAKIGRALPVETLGQTAEALIPNVRIIPDVGEALTRVMENADPEDVICVAGSLYIVGEAKECLEKNGIPAFSREG